MKPLFAVSLALAALAISAPRGTHAQAQPKTGTTHQGMGMNAADAALMDKEKQMWDAFAKKDVARFKQVGGSEKMPSIDPSGITDFDPQMMMQCEVKNWALGDMKVTHLTADVALLTYSATVEGRCSGGPIPSKVYASSIWVRHGSKWVGHFHQETTAAPTPGQMERKE